jgi:signal transduction histidine kinase
MADLISIRRIVENLVSNAVDSLKGERGRVALSVGPFVDDRGRPHTRVTVADSGSGMSPDEKNRIFENFYTTKEKGTGLGLSIVRRLTMDLGGSISVESEPGKGSRFTIDLPTEEPGMARESSP